MINWLIRHVLVVTDRWARQIDVRTLWPALIKNAQDVEMARHAFLLHAQNDPAWTRHYTQSEITQAVNELPIVMEQNQ
jgi:hypothetical protein